MGRGQRKLELSVTIIGLPCTLAENLYCWVLQRSRSMYFSYHSFACPFTTDVVAYVCMQVVKHSHINVTQWPAVSSDNDIH